jgi:hypothetical protein
LVNLYCTVQSYQDSFSLLINDTDPTKAVNMHERSHFKWDQIDCYSRGLTFCELRRWHSVCVVDFAVFSSCVVLFVTFLVAGLWLQHYCAVTLGLGMQ